MTEVGEDRASVDLRATFDYRWSGDPVSHWYSGPVQLHKVDGHWKILDYLKDGASVAGSIVRLASRSTKKADVEIEPLLASSQTRSSTLWFAISNHRDSPVWMNEAVLARRSQLLPLRLRGPRESAPGERSVKLVGWESRTRIARRLRLVLPVFDLERRRWSLILFAVGVG